MRKTISFLAICLCVVCITAHAEQLYQNDTYRFSFVVPDHCKVIEEESDAQSAAFSIYNTQNRTFVAYIRYRNTYEKGKLLDYRKTRKNLLNNNDTITIINEKPFYNLLRQDIQYTSLYKGDETYTKMLLKASSYICITCYYPLSQDAQQILDTFDNQTTFRGNLARVKQNAGSIAMCVYLSLLCFIGYRTRNKELQWLYILLSLILLSLPIICIWQDTQVMLFILAIVIGMWLFFFSHNKYLMWLIDSIF